MKGVKLARWAVMYLAVLTAPAMAAPVMAAEAALPVWRFAGQVDSSGDCDLQVQGSVLDDQGADVQLACPDNHSLIGNLHITLPARAMQQRRVLLRAEIKNDDRMMAGLWLKATRDTQTRMVADDTEQVLFGAAADQDGWQERELSLPVDVDVTELDVGMRLQGRGQVALRNVRVVVSRPGAMTPAAVQYLDAAIGLLKSQLPDRAAMHWNVLEPQMRVLASGAQSTQEVYPAIRYALAQLGGRDDLLLAPAIARALSVGNSSNKTIGNKTIGRWDLSDGARLVLIAPEPVRTAAARLNDAGNVVN